MKCVIRTNWSLLSTPHILLLCDLRELGNPVSDLGFNFKIKRIMKHLERITLMTATAVYTGYLIQQVVRTRADRLIRLAAGESPYERSHPKPRATAKF